MISHAARQITATIGTTMRERPEPSMPGGSLAGAEKCTAADAAVAEAADRIIGGLQPVPGRAEHDHLHGCSPACQKVLAGLPVI
jgi:hypothetical protein